MTDSKWIENLYSIEREDREKFLWDLVAVVAKKNPKLITEAVAIFKSKTKEN